MALLAVEITEAGREKLGLVLAIVNWICISSGLVLLGIGAYIKVSVLQYVNLAEDYDDATLPYMLMSVGLLVALVNGIGGYICYSGSQSSMATKMKMFFIPYMVITVLLVICVLAGGIMCYTHITHLHDSFKDGLTASMKKYKNVKMLKVELDTLQMTYKCCGNNHYSDWFHVNWIHEDYLNTKNTDIQGQMGAGGYKSDDVPFSCCDPDSHRPCVHHHVHDNTKHFNYDYRAKTTLYKHGCRKALMSFFGEDLLTNAGAVVLLVFGLQLLLLLGVRFLQSSVFNAIENGDLSAPAYGWIFDFGILVKEKPTETDNELIKPSHTNLGPKRKSKVAFLDTESSGADAAERGLGDTTEQDETNELTELLTEDELDDTFDNTVWSENEEDPLYDNLPYEQ